MDSVAAEKIRSFLEGGLARACRDTMLYMEQSEEASLALCLWQNPPSLEEEEEEESATDTELVTKAMYDEALYSIHETLDKVAVIEKRVRKQERKREFPFVEMSNIPDQFLNALVIEDNKRDEPLGEVFQFHPVGNGPAIEEFSQAPTPRKHLAPVVRSEANSEEESVAFDEEENEEEDSKDRQDGHRVPKIKTMLCNSSRHIPRMYRLWRRQEDEEEDSSSGVL